MKNCLDKRCLMKCQIYQSSLNEWKPTLFHLNSKDAYVYELAFPDTESVISTVFLSGNVGIIC